ncbi:hypothetical protein LTR66_003175 [Elasticomyces elasticus]|nr:hypothetical protein LTR66_003175 [Elasticomyces elasticus]
MAGAGSPYIKDEPNDFHFNLHQYQPSQQHPAYSAQQQQQQHNYSFAARNGDMNNVDPTQLMNGFTQSFGNNQNMSSSFIMGNSGIADDELLDLGNLDDPNGHNTFQPTFGNNNGMAQQNGSTSHFGNESLNGMSMSMNQGHMNGIYSRTPDGAPIQSPFVNDFNYNQFRPVPNQQSFSQSVPTSNGYTNNALNIQRAQMQNMERKISDSRSPVTPNTPGVDGFHLGEQQHPHASVQLPYMAHRQHSSISNWDSTPSGHSWGDQSPFSSPQNGQMHQPQISEILKSSKHVASSLPTKIERGTSTPAFQSQEAKKRRRRDSHNQVERRRRDNINERIADLASLVPRHRLDDEKVRKHLQTNSPLSPSMVPSGISPPPATSLLAGGNGRRAASGNAGNITQGLPLEDKDRGPNKGDILSGSVAWTRDLMWMIHMKMQEEEQLRDTINQLGGTWPFDETEEERRMRSEVNEVIARNINVGGWSGYSRGPGSGLRVPGFTNIAGDPVDPNQMSPEFATGANGHSALQDQQFWQHQGTNGNHGFKEEDEYGMEMQ